MSTIYKHVYNTYLVARYRNFSILFYNSFGEDLISVTSELFHSVAYHFDRQNDVSLYIPFLV